ncbi:hypothetical protein [Streptomyces sp. NPDC088348]|uniref:hypothetical protein n=1 Tax=Streptomyces sp. NPDC088348 TaxID=3365853 RepID=UPI003824F9D3
MELGPGQAGQEEFRTLAGVRGDAALTGSGGPGRLLRSGPAVTVAGIEASPAGHGAPPVVPYVRVNLSLRSRPWQDSQEAQRRSVTRLAALRPSGAAPTAASRSRAAA